MPGVYLLHFNPPYRHARHYLGFAHDIDARLAAHLQGRGARLVEVAVEAGCQVELARIWPSTDRAFERHLKRQKNTPRLCPLCHTHP